MGRRVCLSLFFSFLAKDLISACHSEMLRCFKGISMPVIQLKKNGFEEKIN
jgi:hypothetical protein